MLPGPIFTVELVTSARRARYFLVRAAYATVLLCALWFVHQSTLGTYSYRRVPEDDIHAIAAFSAAFFGTFAVLQLLAVVLLGPAMVAGTIATERERRTIEYLFASSLSNAEIVLGKLAARLVHVVYLVLAGLPVLALVMLLGGIAPEALLVLLVLTLSTALTVSTLSIAVSVWSARAREAVTRAYLVLFALLVIPPLLMLLRNEPFYDRFVAPANDQFVSANPFVATSAAIIEASGTSRGTAMDIVVAFVRNHLIASFLLAAASTLAVRRAHLVQRDKAPARRKWRLAQFFRPAVGNRPMLWKEIFAEPAAARLGSVGRIALTLIVLGVIAPTLYMFYEAQSGVGNLPYRSVAEEYMMYALTMGTMLGCGGLLLVASRAAGSIASEKERDCWTSLISTPLEPGEIVRAKIAGSVWSIRGVVMLLLLIWGLGVVLDAHFLFVVPFLLGTFVLLAFYAAALGVWFSLRCRTSPRAMGATLATGLLVGGGYLFCCMPLMFGPGPGRAGEITLAPCIPMLLALPGIAYEQATHSYGNDEMPILVLTYFLGVIGYRVATFVLLAGSISTFDARTGPTRLMDPVPRDSPADAILVPDSAPQNA